MVPTHNSAPLPAAHDESRYRLFGDFHLCSPEQHLHPHGLHRLRQLGPYLRQLEFPATPGKFSTICTTLLCTDANIGCQTRQEYVFNLSEAFREFQELESKSWAHPRRKDGLVAPSGSLTWPIICTILLSKLSHHMREKRKMRRVPVSG